MKTTAILIFVLSYLSGVSAFAQTQNEMNFLASDNLKKAEQKMDSVLTLILSKYDDDPVFISSIKEAQNTWLTFRDAHLKSLYPLENKRRNYGSVYPMCASDALISMTNQRIEQLQIWLKGTEEGDVCSGSIKLNSQIE